MNNEAASMRGYNRPDQGSVPTVSVIIATYRRPRAVVSAVRSALAQSLEAIEVVVVVDGPDEATTQALAAFSDPRLRVLVSPSNVGQAAATNLAIGEARAAWIAFLDDDDLWLPHKLERQMMVAEQSPHPYPIISCRLIARNESRDFVWPRRRPKPGQPLDEYLFCRRWPMAGEGMVQNSTIVTPAKLFRIASFTAGLKRFVDLDWLIHVKQVTGAEVAFVESDEPLVIWHIEGGRNRVSNQDDWRWALSYIRERRPLMTARAYGAFLMTLVSASAAKQGDWSAFLPLLREAYATGRPGLIEALNHVANFCLPRAAQAVAAGLSGSRRRGSDT